LSKGGEVRDSSLSGISATIKPVYVVLSPSLPFFFTSDVARKFRHTGRTSFVGEIKFSLDNQTAKANARLPYNSTLLMTETEFDLANKTGSPGMPELSGNVRGEKEW
jgi:hypothetical protein